MDAFSVGLAGPRGETQCLVRIRAIAVAHEGSPAALLTIFHETAERRARAGLQENEARLDAVLESASDGLLLLEDTPAGAVVRMTNAALLSILGLRREDILGATEGEMLRRLRSLPVGETAQAEALREVMMLTINGTPAGDVGCALGLMRAALQQHFPRASYSGLEVSESLCRKYGWEQGSAASFASRQPFDAVICYDVLQYLGDPGGRRRPA